MNYIAGSLLGAILAMGLGGPAAVYISAGVLALCLLVDAACEGER